MKKDINEVQYVPLAGLPAAIARMSKQVECLSVYVGHIEKRLNIINEAVGNIPTANLHAPVGIERASEITGKSVSTLYRYSSQGLIPCYKIGKHLCFFEDELIDWVKGRKVTQIQDLCDAKDKRFLPLTTRKGL